jgi:hypothetical protein
LAKLYVTLALLASLQGLALGSENWLYFLTLSLLVLGKVEEQGLHTGQRAQNIDIEVYLFPALF